MSRTTYHRAQPIFSYKPICKINIRSNTRLFCHIMNLLYCKILTFTISMIKTRVNNLVQQHVSIHHIKCSLKINKTGIYLYLHITLIKLFKTNMCSSPDLPFRKPLCSSAKTSLNSKKTNKSSSLWFSK